MRTYKFKEEVTETTSTYVPKQGMRDKDETIPYRIVGTYEYDQALKLLTQLISQSTPEQIETYNKMLQERAEFTFLNGVAAAFVDRPNLDQANEDDRKKFNDKFKRKGLAWMMALAKVELGATISLYGESRFPFNELKVTKFEATPMLELLSNDVAAHMKSLAKEPLFKEVMKRNHYPDSDTVAYIRRLKLIKDMLVTLRQSNDPAIASAIAPYQKTLAKHEKFLVAQVMSREAQAQFESESNSIIRDREASITSFSGPCQGLLQAGQGTRHYPSFLGGDR